MYKNILIAVDLAAELDSVLAKGKEIADKFGAQYHAIYCIDQPVTAFGEVASTTPVINLTQLKHDAFPHFKEAAEKVGIDAQHISIEIGHHSDTILEYADKNDVDLIVIGSHGKRGLQLLLGSTANSVLHHAKCDVLAVRIKK